MKLLVIAAGYATRLYPLTRDRPKALLPVGGKPMLDHVLASLSGIGADRTYVVTNAKFAPQFREWAAGRLAADSQKAALRHGVLRGPVCLNVLKGSGPGLAYPRPITPTVVPEAREAPRATCHGASTVSSLRRSDLGFASRLLSSRLVGVGLAQGRLAPKKV